MAAMDFMEFIEFLRKYDDIEITEKVEEEMYVVNMTCGGKLLMNHTIIKCKCETADEIRTWVYSNTAEALFKKGYDFIVEKCGERK